MKRIILTLAAFFVLLFGIIICNTNSLNDSIEYEIEIVEVDGKVDLYAINVAASLDSNTRNLIMASDMIYEGDRMIYNNYSSPECYGGTPLEEALNSKNFLEAKAAETVKGYFFIVNKDTKPVKIKWKGYCYYRPTHFSKQYYFDFDMTTTYPVIKYPDM